MENIKTFIIEKLKISSNTSINDTIDDITEIKHGEIIVYKSKMFNNYHIGIFSKYDSKSDSVEILASYDYDKKMFYSEIATWSDRMTEMRYANKEEIDELMEIIDNNGYKYVKDKKKIKIIKK